LKKIAALVCVVLISACAPSPERQAEIDAENAKVKAFPAINLDTEQNIVIKKQSVSYDGVAVLTTNEDAIYHIKSQCMQTAANGIVIDRVFDYNGVKENLLGEYQGGLTRAEGRCVKVVTLNNEVIPSLLSEPNILNFRVIDSYIKKEKIDSAFIANVTTALKHVLESTTDLSLKRDAFSRVKLIDNALLSKSIRYSDQINQETQAKIFPYLKQALVGSGDESLMAMEALYYNNISPYFHDSMIAVAKYHPSEKMRIFASGYLAKLGNQVDVEGLRNQERSAQVRSYQGQLLLNAALLDSGKLLLFRKES